MIALKLGCLLTAVITSRYFHVDHVRFGQLFSNPSQQRDTRLERLCMNFIRAAYCRTTLVPGYLPLGVAV